MVQASLTSSASGAAEGQGRRLGGGAIVSLTGAGPLLVFMIQNTDDVTLDFLFWSFTWPLWLFTLVMALVGVRVVRTWRDAPSSAAHGAPRGVDVA